MALTPAEVRFVPPAAAPFPPAGPLLPVVASTTAVVVALVAPVPAVATLQPPLWAILPLMAPSVPPVFSVVLTNPLRCDEAVHQWWGVQVSVCTEQLVQHTERIASVFAEKSHIAGAHFTQRVI